MAVKSQYAASERGAAGYVYLIREATGYYKIGKAKDINDRLKTFEVKLPFQVIPEHIIKTNDRHKLESALHAKFASKRVNGEWFALAPGDVDYIKRIS